MNRKKLHAPMKAGPGSAFTFVEVIAALAIVSISLLALLRLHIISIAMADKAQITSQAVLLANEKIEETLAGGYPALGTKSGTAEKDALPLYWQTQVTELHIPDLDQAGIRGLREVSVSVTHEQDLANELVQMSTYVADGKVK